MRQINLHTRRNVFCFTYPQLQRAFEAVAAHEREACEADCESVVDDSNSIAENPLLTTTGKDINKAMAMGASNCLVAIRARAIKKTS